MDRPALAADCGTTGRKGREPHEFGARRGRTPHELFSDYVAGEGIADQRIVALFDRLHDDVLAEVP